LENDNHPKNDVVIIGGGPVGATAALLLTRAGKRVIVLEKSAFPRFHVGESFLPAGFELIKQLGLGEQLSRLPRMTKVGAEFGFGHGKDTSCFDFSESLFDDGYETFNIERAIFDDMMLEAAADAGAEVRTEANVRRIIRLNEGDIAVEVDGNIIEGKCLLDASGQGTVLARHLGCKKIMQHHRKVAYFGHFQNVQRLPGQAEGHPTVAMCDEGWFWLINIDKKRTSIGMVLDSDIARSIDYPASEMLHWGIQRCPLVRDRTKSAVFPDQTHTIADFSYYCRPFAGPGYFLIGDAAFFLDPIFSSGLGLGMEMAVRAAADAEELLTHLDGTRTTNGKKPRKPSGIRRDYINYINQSSAPFVTLVNLFYDHSFRELFLHGQGPVNIQPAIISILSGYIFPKISWPLKWRLHLMELFTKIHARVAIVPRRDSHSLCSTQPTPLPLVEAVATSA